MTWDNHGGPECGGCGAEGVTLFFLPGGWGWKDDMDDGRLGLCEGCGTTNPQYTERFRAHFGDIGHISDTDSGAASEVA